MRFRFWACSRVSPARLPFSAHHLPPASTRIHFLLAVAGIQLRLLANMLDGMVAIAAAKSSPIGELFNEIPDRLSDTAILVAAGYACSGLPVLGWAAAAVALFVTYVRALGKSMGVPALFQGPMSKSHRMFTLTLACVYLACARRMAAADSHDPATGRNHALALLLVIVGGAITALRRIARIRRALLEQP